MAMLRKILMTAAVAALVAGVAGPAAATHENPPGTFDRGEADAIHDDPGDHPFLRTDGWFPLPPPSYANSQVYPPANKFAYPWEDNFCENRWWRSNVIPVCDQGPGSGYHAGQDIRPPTDEAGVWEIRASWGGPVSNTACESGPGWFTRVDSTFADGSTVRHKYFHMHWEPLVHPGESVVQGQLLGYVGHSAGGGGTYCNSSTTSNHLHYETWLLNGTWQVQGPYPTLVDAYHAERYTEQGGSPPPGGGGGGPTDDDDQYPGGCDPTLDTDGSTFWGTCWVARSTKNAGDSEGGLVAWVQRTVTDTGIDTLVVDGLFGPATESGVIDYQNAYGTTGDGIVGNNSWIRMDMYGNIAPWSAATSCGSDEFRYYTIDGSLEGRERCGAIDPGELCIKVDGSWERADTRLFNGCPEYPPGISSTPTAGTQQAQAQPRLDLPLPGVAPHAPDPSVSLDAMQTALAAAGYAGEIDGQRGVLLYTGTSPAVPGRQVVVSRFAGSVAEYAADRRFQYTQGVEEPAVGALGTVVEDGGAAYGYSGDVLYPDEWAAVQDGDEVVVVMLLLDQAADPVGQEALYAAADAAALDMAAAGFGGLALELLPPTPVSTTN